MVTFKSPIFMRIFDSYGVLGSIRLARDLFLTQIDTIVHFKSKIRLIRRPVYIRGKKYIKIGNNFTSGVGLRLDAFPRQSGNCIIIGNNVEINDYVHIGAIKSVVIGNDVLVASKVFISDHNHGSYGKLGKHDNPLTTIPRDRELSYSPVLIQDSVWIGESVTILPGVTIGTGSIIGCMSVVTHDIPAFSVAAGIPARVIKSYNFDTSEWVRCS